MFMGSWSREVTWCLYHLLGIANELALQIFFMISALFASIYSHLLSQHWMPYWASIAWTILSHTELFWCLMPCCIVVYIREQYDCRQCACASCAIWRRVEVLYLEKEGVLALIALPCIGLNPTRSAYFSSDGCEKVRNEFPPLHLDL